MKLYYSIIIMIIMNIIINVSGSTQLLQQSFSARKNEAHLKAILDERWKVYKLSTTAADITLRNNSVHHSDWICCEWFEIAEF